MRAFLQVPQHGHLRFLPPSSPELQPAEHLWPLTNAALVSDHFPDLDALDEAQFARCTILQRQPDRVGFATLFKWRPRRVRKRQDPRRN